jgi:chromosomal replication initiation ATPase DnaA
MARQLTFDLPARTALGRDAFYISTANSVAAAAIDAWRDWPLGKLALTGPEGAGKTHLARVWAEAAGALVLAAGAAHRPVPGERLVIEDVDRIAGDGAAEERLFHLHNALLAGGGSLLVTGRRAPVDWGLALPDLASRMEGTPMVRIAPPDDALLAAVLAKQFADRQLTPPADLIPWLLVRMRRSFAAAADIVARLDALALTERRPITTRLAARILDNPETSGA